jgi:hypothetical protein
MRVRFGHLYLPASCLGLLLGASYLFAQSEINRPLHSAGPLGEMMNEVSAKRQS